MKNFNARWSLLGSVGSVASWLLALALSSSSCATSSPEPSSHCSIDCSANGGVISNGGQVSGVGGVITLQGGVGGVLSATGGAASGGAGVEEYTLVVDEPKSGASVSSPVLVRGSAPGFRNVEVWDTTHQKPPLCQATPAANGAFTCSVTFDTLARGAAQWTVWAWDTAPGVTPTRSASVALNLTLADEMRASGGAANGGASNGGTSNGGMSNGGMSNGGMSSGGMSSGGISSGGVANGGAGVGGVGGGSSAETVGSGSVDAPAVGPAPTEAAKAGSGAFTLVKNWNFGSSGTIRNIAELSAEFMYHDQFGTIGNGSNYGAITVAPSSATAISGQPVEDAARPYREFTGDSMKAYVRPLSATQSSVSVSAHNAGNGSITAKWTLASGGKLLGKDLLWETRVRMPVTVAAYWFAIWTAGNKWDRGAEMDVLESFGTPNIYPPPAAFHVNSVGGSDSIDYSSWPNGLDSAGVPTAERDLRDYHIFTWLYRKDDSYVVYYDGHVVQSGKLIWTLGGSASGEHINMSFLFDFGWGHTQISDVNISLPASTFGITYEIDYSRVYLR